MGGVDEPVDAGGPVGLLHPKWAGGEADERRTDADGERLGVVAAGGSEVERGGVPAHPLGRRRVCEESGIVERGWWFSKKHT